MPNLLDLLPVIKGAMQSQIVGGGMVLMLTGGIMAAIRQWPGRAWTAVKRRFIISLDVIERDAPFYWMTVWLDKHPYAKKARAVTVGSVSRGDEYKPIFTPAPGRHYFWYKRRLIMLTRTREMKQGGQGYNESIHLQTFGRSPQVLHDLILEAQEAARSPSNDINVFVLQHSSWTRLTSFEPRPLTTVLLPDGVADAVEKDLKDFKNARDWYTRRGIPWRRGYLLHGPPGTGKTSLIAALAGQVHFDLYILNLASGSMSDESLMSMLLNVPKGGAVVMEDVDSVVSGRDMVAAGQSLNGSTVTFAGLLNALDGVASKPGQIIFMTTNHPEKLDPALVRSGRVDYRIEFHHATASQIERLFLHFYDDASLVDEANAFAAAFRAREKSPTMADIQQHLLTHKNNPQEAVRTAA